MIDDAKVGDTIRFRFPNETFDSEAVVTEVLWPRAKDGLLVKVYMVDQGGVALPVNAKFVINWWCK